MFIIVLVSGDLILFWIEDKKLTSLSVEEATSPRRLPSYWLRIPYLDSLIEPSSYKEPDLTGVARFYIPVSNTNTALVKLDKHDMIYCIKSPGLLDLRSIEEHLADCLLWHSDNINCELQNKILNLFNEVSDYINMKENE